MKREQTRIPKVTKKQLKDDWREDTRKKLASVYPCSTESTGMNLLRELYSLAYKVTPAYARGLVPEDIQDIVSECALDVLTNAKASDILYHMAHYVAYKQGIREYARDKAVGKMLTELGFVTNDEDTAVIGGVTPPVLRVHPHNSRSDSQEDTSTSRNTRRMREDSQETPSDIDTEDQSFEAFLGSFFESNQADDLDAFCAQLLGETCSISAVECRGILKRIVRCNMINKGVVLANMHKYISYNLDDIELTHPDETEDIEHYYRIPAGKGSGRHNTTDSVDIRVMCDQFRLVLSDTEARVFDLLVQGDSGREIAESLHMRRSTVISAIKSIREGILAFDIVDSSLVASMQNSAYSKRDNAHQ